jgi:hypothetical protein
MTFTIITIIFLPLSFMSSIFGMNARELSGPDGGVMSLKYQFKVICKSQPLRKLKAKYDIFSTYTAYALVSVSIGLIVLSLILAFSSWIQDTFAFLRWQSGIKMRRNLSANLRAKNRQ